MKSSECIEDTKEYLRHKGNVLRRRIVEMLGVGHPGHIGGSCSIADIVACLYFYKLGISVENFNSKARNRFIMSKGHSVLAQYAALGELGFFNEEEFKKVKTLKGILQGHPDIRKTPGIEANTGSLGQGLSIACGMALGMKLDKLPHKVYVVMGDGELAEGEIWEAAMAASWYKLDNVVGIVDKNGLTSVGFMKDRFNIHSIGDKFKAFGWTVFEIDGHDIGQIIDVLDKTDKVKDTPCVIIANTVKGKGISFAESSPSCHNSSLSEEEYLKAIQDVDMLLMKER